MRIGLVALVAAWALLMPVIGFVVTGLAAFLAFIALATFERLDIRTTATYGITAVLVVGVFQLLMDGVLGMRMPMGWLI